MYGHHFRIFPCVYIIFPCMRNQFPCTQLGYEYSQNTALIFRIGTAWVSLSPSQCSVSCDVPAWGPLAREKVGQTILDFNAYFNQVICESEQICDSQQFPDSLLKHLYLRGIPLDFSEVSGCPGYTAPFHSLLLPPHIQHNSV